MEPKITYNVNDELIRGVIARAVMSEPRRMGLWQDMLRALYQGGHRERLFVLGDGGPAAGRISYR